MTIQDVLKQNMLHFLPAKTLCRFKSVCKDWNQWINSPFSVLLQSCYFRDKSGVFCQIPYETPLFVSLDPSACGVPRPDLKFFPEAITIRAACNGLLLCTSTLDVADPNYYICNPANKDKQWKQLPKPQQQHEQVSAVALAFDPSLHNLTPCFKIVRAIPSTDRPVLYFEIYSSQLNYWRVVEFQCCYSGALILKGDGFFLNGTVFWETHVSTLLAFDMKNEQYSMLLLPPSNRFQGVLTAMHGKLCYMRPQRGDTGEEELAMEVYGDLKMTLKHKIPLNLELLPLTGVEELRALPCVNDDTLMLLVGTKLCVYHIKEEWIEVIFGDIYQDEDVKILPYVNSLVSVDEMIRGE